MSEPPISVRGVSKRYALYSHSGDRLRELLSLGRRRMHEEQWALRGVSFEVPRGATWGIVGRNGAGKSTLLKIIAGRLRPTSGEAVVRGRVSSILELGTGFQEQLTGRQNAKINALFIGYDPWQVDRKLGEILEFAGLGPYADQPLHTYSSGMKARLAFSVLTGLSPEVLVLDEALATGDAGFAERCRIFLRGLCRAGCTTLVTGHDLAFLAEACDQLVWLEAGEVKACGDPPGVIASYLRALSQEGGLELDRPRAVLLRFSAEPGGESLEYDLHCLEWESPQGEVFGTQYVGDDACFEALTTAGRSMGLSRTGAHGGWGPTQSHENGSKYRRVTPSRGPNGAAYLGMPVPGLPHPAPAALRVAGRNDLTRGVTVSMLVDGDWRRLGSVGTGAVPGEIPWFRVRLPLLGELAGAARSP